MFRGFVLGINANAWRSGTKITALKIGTLDNPGWSLRIDLEGTPLRGETFQEHQTEWSNDDWIVARKNFDVFEASGGPVNLNGMIEDF